MHTKAITALIAGMKRQRVQRIMMLSAAGARETWKSAPALSRAFIRLSNIKLSYADNDAAEALVAASGLDWYALIMRT